jgi:hypothetical protein
MRRFSLLVTKRRFFYALHFDLMMIRVRTCQSGIKFVSELGMALQIKREGENAVKRILIVAAVLLSTVVVAAPVSAGQIDDYIDGPWMNAYSDAIRHLIPIDSATRFRRKAPPDSDRFRHPGLELGDAG